MNVLYIIYKYLDIKAGNKPKRPITMIFGAKAAPAYIIAKDIIHVILMSAGTDQRNDPEVSPYLQVVNGRELQRNNGRKTDSCM